MERINKILSSPQFIRALSETKKSEKDRIYCLHGLEHAVDTARISYILNLEEGAELKKDVIYAAALLHDTGRYRQYADGTPHQKASVIIAAEILPLCGFEESEISDILCAIDTHRHGETKNKLGEILQRADNLSRLCFDCSARDTCKWTQEEMNMGLEY